MILDVCATSTS